MSVFVFALAAALQSGPSDQIPAPGNLPVRNRRLSAEEKILCSSKEGRAILARRISPEMRAYENEQVKKYTDLRTRLENSAGAEKARAQGRSYPLPPPAPDLNEFHEREEAPAYCENDGNLRYAYTVGAFEVLSIERQIQLGDSAPEQRFTFDNQLTKACWGDGGKNRAYCSAQVDIELPQPYQVCKVHIQPSRNARWLPGRIEYYAARPYLTNPADGTAPRARGVTVYFSGYTTNNYPIRMSLDVTIDAVAVEVGSDARFARGCKVIRERDDFFRKNNPRPEPGTVMENVNL